MNRRPDVTATRLPVQSALHERVGASDFLDCFAVASDLSPRRAAEIFTTFPGWVRSLMRLRRVVTAPFGLSNDGPAARDKIGIFPVETETGSEIIAGFNDRHLNFRVSILSHDRQIFAATWVHPHNRGGRLYLAAVLPFHKLVVRNGLARVAAHDTPA